MRENLENEGNIRLFKLIGVLCYKFHRHKGLSMQELKEMIERKELTFDDVEKMPETSYMTAILNTEVHRCMKKS